MSSQVYCIKSEGKSIRTERVKRSVKYENKWESQHFVPGLNSRSKPHLDVRLKCNCYTYLAYLTRYTCFSEKYIPKLVVWLCFVLDSSLAFA